MALPLTPSTRLADHREAHVDLRCGACGHRREVRADALARMLGWETPLKAHVRRFRCSRCGARRVEIQFGYEHRPRGWQTHS